MDILRNNREIQPFTVKPVSFEDLKDRLSEIEAMVQAGYKAEVLDVLNVAQGMVNSLADRDSFLACQGRIR